MNISYGGGEDLFDLLNEYKERILEISRKINQTEHSDRIYFLFPNGKIYDSLEGVLIFKFFFYNWFVKYEITKDSCDESVNIKKIIINCSNGKSYNCPLMPVELEIFKKYL